MSTSYTAGKKRYRSRRPNRRRRYGKRSPQKFRRYGRYRRGPNSRVYAKWGTRKWMEEQKYFDTAATNIVLQRGATSIAPYFGWNGGYLGCFNGVVQGDDYYNRDGNQIRMKYLYVKGQINWEPGAANAPLTSAPLAAGAFLAVVLDTQTNTQACPSEQIFSNGANIAAGYEGASMLLVNPLARKRFRVLKEQRFIVSNRNFVGVVGNPLTAHMSNTAVQFEWYIPLNYITTEFTTPNGGITNISTNSLNLYGWGYDATGNITNNVKISFNARLRFYG